MLDRKFAKSGLKHFKFKKTGWYQTIRDENRHYKYILLRNTTLVCLAVPLVLAALAVKSGATAYLPSCAASAVILSVVLFALMRYRRLKPLIIVALALPFIGSLAAAYAPYGENVNRAILVCYPLLAVQLKGTRVGSAWFASFLLYYSACAALSSSGVIPPWYVEPTMSTLPASLVSALIVYALALYAEIRQDALLGRLSDHFVFDEVTGLPGKEVLVHSIDPEQSYLFAIIKIENYSDLVALFGYEFSDTISQFASRKLLKHESRFHYKTYQLKYNEYGILIEQERQMDIVDSAQLLSEVIKALEIESLPWESDRINLVYRVGGALVMPGDDMTPLSKADIALKKAERGHSVITIFDEGNTEKESARDYVIKFTELINNRENDSFLTVFQPIFTGDGLGIAWYEALLRIRQQDGTYTSIYPYLPVAKSTGFYRYLTDFVIRRSAEAIVAYDIDVSINIAIHDIVRPEFLLLVDEVYEKIRDKKGRIIFELLESDELVELDKCLWFIDYVSRYGFKIAIDDFGTGYSNYCSLINLPIDIVKIDGSLIKKIHHDENAKILVEGIVTFCEKSNKKTVAEFVEDKAVMDSLRSMKIDFLQVYYLAKPGHIDSVVTFSDTQ
jgi:EAL domain-containing protein (putative c-di-GMP-specific phosphodiesterase class I)